MRPRTLFPILFPFVFSIPAGAQLITPFSQERTVIGDTTVFSGGTTESDSAVDAAPDFLPFFSAVDVTVVLPTMLGTGGGFQDSEIGTDGLRAEGTMFATAQYTGDGTDFAFADSFGISRFLVSFELHEQATYTVTGDISAFDGGLGIVSLWSDASGSLWYEDTTGFDEGERIGVAPPGLYSFSVHLTGSASGTVGSDYASGDYDFRLDFVPFETGAASCFGIGCPCMNDDPRAGCANSTGFGGSLLAYGGTSVQTDDVLLVAGGLPPSKPGIFFMGDATTQSPLFDGLRCAGGQTWRFSDSVQDTGAAGEMQFGPGLVAVSNGLITPGSTWHFQCWHRDLTGAVCGTGANLTNLYSVNFTL